MTTTVDTSKASAEIVLDERELDLQIAAIEEADTGLVFGAFAMNLRAVDARI